MSASGRVAADRAVRVALAGAGQFGVTLAAALSRLADIDLVAVADRDVDRARGVLAVAGHGDARECADAAAARAAIETGAAVACAAPGLLAGLPVDVVVEATGNPESGAALAEAAIAAGHHVVMASKETDCPIGPLLAARAGEAGTVYTLVEGDQPSLLVGLFERARSMGLEIVSAGKATEYDFVFDPTRGTLAFAGRSIDAPALARCWTLADDVAATLVERDALLGSFPRRTAADLCEMAVTANAIGLGVDVPQLHGPLLRTPEIPDVMRPRVDGGVLGAPGCLDVFNCLRRPDEASFAGGVFVVVRWPEGETARVLAGKGMPTSRDGRLGLLHNPVHLLGVEAIVSIRAAAREGRATAAPARPVLDLVARSTRALAAGETLTVGGHFHEIDGTSPLLLPATALGADAPLPYYLAADAVLARDVGAGTVITAADVHEPAGAVLWRLRREQDTRFLAR